jgi:2-iminobutanoate/2-iminopropanoate deaminase
MQIRKLNSSKVTQPAGGYAQVLEVSGAQRFAFVSGQIPQSLDGKVPSGFDEQCRQVWSNIEAQLAAADMTLANLVKVTTSCPTASTTWPTARSATKSSVSTRLP